MGGKNANFILQTFNFTIIYLLIIQAKLRSGTMIKKVIFNNSKSNYIWNEDFDKYTDKQIEALDIETINFAYDNAISMLEQIRDALKMTRSRAASLASFLSAYITGRMIFFGLDLPVNEFLDIFSIVLLIGYFLVAIVTVCFVLIPSSVDPTHTNPKFIMEKSNFKNDIKVIKIKTIKKLKNKLKRNNAIQDKSANYLKGCIFASIAIPIAAVFIATAVTPDFIFNSRY